MAASTGPDVYYYDLVIRNADNLTISRPTDPTRTITGSTPIEVTVNSSVPILDNPSEYYGAVIRMGFTGYSIPLIQYHVATSGGIITDVNRGIYSFTCDFSGSVGAPVHYQFVPQLYTGVTAPLPGGTIQDYGNSYYDLFDYTWFVDKIMNPALQGAFQSVQAAASPLLDTALMPFFNYESPTGIISLYTDPRYAVNYWFNVASYPFMAGFAYTEHAVGSADGRDELFYVNPSALNQVTISGAVYTKTAQQFLSLEYYSPLSTVLVTTTMPIVPVNYNISSIDGRGASNLGTVTLMTDFVPDLGQPIPGLPSYRFIYNASSLYRVFEHMSQAPLTQLQAGFQWVDQLGNVRVLRQPKGQTTNLLLMYIKKDLYDPNLKIIDGQVQIPGARVHRETIQMGGKSLGPGSQPGFWDTRLAQEKKGIRK